VFGPGKRITPELRAFWLYDDGGSIASRSLASLLGQNITATAANAGRNAALLGAGLTMDWGKNTSLFVDYNYEQRSARNGQSVLGGLRINW
jgi:outer membrane autotransporter protein